MGASIVSESSSSTIRFEHTAGHADCPACEEERRQAVRLDSLAELDVAQAGARWLEDKALYLQARTLKDYRQYFRALSLFFGTLKLRDIDVGSVRAYQKWRMQNGPARAQAEGKKPAGRPAGAGNTRINSELRVLGQMLAEANLWRPIRKRYQPLPEPTEGPGVALTEEQAKEMFRIAGTHKRWEVALWISILQSHTAMGPGEVRHLQLGDLNLAESRLVVRRALKNRFRAREIDLVPTALYAARKLMERARRLGASDPTHYVLPLRRHGSGEASYDPTRPQSSWRSAWDGMRKAAGLPRLRPYDLRHTSITWLLSHPSVPPQVVQEIAGWANLKMAKRYSHQNRSAKRAALSAALGTLDLFAERPPQPLNVVEELQLTVNEAATRSEKLTHNPATAPVSMPMSSTVMFFRSLSPDPPVQERARDSRRAKRVAK